MENQAILDDLLSFLDNSPTAYHAVDNLKQTLNAAGFEHLDENKSWQIKPSKKYYLVRGGSLIAFIAPNKRPSKTVILGSHTDSPSFKLKPEAAFDKEGMILLGLEIYGAPLLNSWLNRDLGIAGKICYAGANDEDVKEAIVRIDHSPVTLAQLAIHLDRQVNENGVTLHKQDHLAAIAGLKKENQAPSQYFQTLFQEILGDHALLTHDLFLFPLEKAGYIGLEKELIASYRIDNLTSVHASALALCQSDPSETTLKIAAFWDHEEIGSRSYSGASSPFLNTTIERVILSLGENREAYLRSLSQTILISIDLAHGLHPNYVDKHDPRHKIGLNKGIVIKYDAGQKYATSSKTGAFIMHHCNKLGIPCSSFVARGDMPSGTTIGPISSSIGGIPTVDIGYAQLSMHSCRELIAAQDHLSMCSLLKELLA